MTVIDGSNLVLGRMATNIASRLLKGENISIINAERIVISGPKDATLKKFGRRFSLAPKGNPTKGPKFPRTPERIVKRAIEGMLPAKRERGRKAIKKLRVYRAIPKELEGEKTEKIASAQKKLKGDYMNVAEISAYFGVKL